MTGRGVATIAGTAAVLALAACGDASRDGAGRPAAAQVQDPERPRGVVENCSTRSEASFPGAFTDRSNVVVGPLVLVGATYTDAATVRQFGGNKFPALVRAGHRVTVALSKRTRRVAGLGYGPLPEGVELTARDGHRVVTFIACRHGRRSGSDVDRRPVTFWSGFVMTTAPRCVPLEVWVDSEPTPRHVTLALGKRRC